MSVFLSRASTIADPCAQFFRRNGLCHPTALSALSLLLPVPPTTCRPALTLSSTLTGVVQLLSLLFCPVVGYLSSRHPPATILFITLLTGASAFLLFSTLTDPRNPLVWISVVGMGISQAGGLVLSLGLVAKARNGLVKREGREIGGSLAGAYSACGGIGILLVGYAAGASFDTFAGAPFALIGAVDVVVAGVAGYCIFVDYRLGRSSSSS